MNGLTTLGVFMSMFLHIADQVWIPFELRSHVCHSIPNNNFKAFRILDNKLNNI